MHLQRLLHQWSFRLLPGRCVACNLPAERAMDLCQVCEANLPRNTCSCAICAEPLVTGGICGRCQSQPPPFSRIIAPLLYASPVNRLIQRFKYQKDLAAGAALTGVLVNHLNQSLQDRAIPDLLLPVPLHWTRLCWRGYNQAGEIAELLCSCLNIPRSDRVIVRRQRTPASQGLSREQRAKNLRHAFAVRSVSLEGLRIGLVDDVVTSSSTVSVLAALLRKHGAEDVEVWCLARTPLEN